MAGKLDAKQEKSTNKKRSYYVPESNEKVFVKFDHGDLRKPIVTGSMWNKTDKPPETSSSKKVKKKVKEFKAAKTIMGSMKKSNSKTKTKKTSKTISKK